MKEKITLMPKLHVVRWMCVLSALSALFIATACSQRGSEQVWSNADYSGAGYKGTINTLAFR
jgi:hypothetical protein